MTEEQDRRGVDASTMSESLRRWFEKKREMAVATRSFEFEPVVDVQNMSRREIAQLVGLGEMYDRVVSGEAGPAAAYHLRIYNEFDDFVVEDEE
jgi:hypothetical protein